MSAKATSASASASASASTAPSSATASATATPPPVSSESTQPHPTPPRPSSKRNKLTRTNHISEDGLPPEIWTIWVSAVVMDDFKRLRDAAVPNASNTDFVLALIQVQQALLASNSIQTFASFKVGLHKTAISRISGNRSEEGNASQHQNRNEPSSFSTLPAPSAQKSIHVIIQSHQWILKWQNLKLLHRLENDGNWAVITLSFLQ
eukprot:jgi/Hompol1/664/HPOL_000875-RA